MFVVADILSSEIIICGPRDSNDIYGDSCIQYVVFCLYSVDPVYVWLHQQLWQHHVNIVWSLCK